MKPLQKFKDMMLNLEESKRELDEAMARLDESMKALESGIPESWKAADLNLSLEDALGRAEDILSRGRLPC